MAAIGFGVSLIAVAWMAHAYDWRALRTALENADWRWLTVVPLVLLCNFLVRAARWQGLFPAAQRPGFVTTFVTMMIGYMFNNVLPARAGELIRVHLIGRRAQLPRSTALGTVVLERTLDLVVLLAMLAAVMFIQPLPGWAAYAGKAVASAAFLALTAVLVAGLMGERLIAMAGRALSFVPPQYRRRLAFAARAFVSGVSVLLRVSHLSHFFSLTAVAWLLELLLVVVIAQAYSLALSPINLLFLMTVVALGTMVPASPGYVGTFEVFGVSALALLGVPEGPALGFVLMLHIAVLFGSTLVGLVCLGWYGGYRAVRLIDE